MKGLLVGGLALLAAVVVVAAVANKVVSGAIEVNSTSKV
jgi:hypothetical protein